MYFEFSCIKDYFPTLKLEITNIKKSPSNPFLYSVCIEITSKKNERFYKLYRFMGKYKEEESIEKRKLYVHELILHAICGDFQLEVEKNKRDEIQSRCDKIP